MRGLGQCCLYLVVVLNLLTTVNVANAETYESYKVDEGFRECVNAPFYPYNKVVRREGAPVAFPYFDTSRTVEFVSGDVATDPEFIRRQQGCHLFSVLQSDLLVEIERGEEYAFRVGYYALSELIGAYSRQEFDFGQVNLSLVYLGVAYSSLGSGLRSCMNLLALDPSHDQFCKKELFLEALRKADLRRSEIETGSHGANPDLRKEVFDMISMIRSEMLLELDDQ